MHGDEHIVALAEDSGLVLAEYLLDTLEVRFPFYLGLGQLGLLAGKARLELRDFLLLLLLDLADLLLFLLL
jgi:hypothetical protein